MTDGNDDRALREQFAALRSEEAGAVPGFANVRARRPVARARRDRRALAIAGAVALVAASIALWPERAPREGMSIADWRSPTDFLLESPAWPLLQASPAVGERWVMVP